MQTKAELALRRPVRSLVDVMNPRSAGGAQDYSSEGDYWWPDPSNPGGPYIRRDGHSNPDNFNGHRKLLIGMAEDVAALAVAWRTTGRPDFAIAAALHLEAWFVDPRTRMNPNLNYSQAIPGICTGRGIGIIDTVQLCEVALSVRLLESHLPPRIFEAVQQWFADYLKWLMTSPAGKDEKRQSNNHGTCWHLQAACFTSLTGNDPVLREMRWAFVDLVVAQMSPDGSFPLELARTKPYAYSLFNLDVFSALAVVLDHGGSGCLEALRPAMEFHTPFVADKSCWPHAHDIANWDEWPLRHAFLYLGGSLLGRKDWLKLWESLPEALPSWEARRNFPIRTPELWIACQRVQTRRA